MAIDERLIKALHVETLRRQDLHAERKPRTADRARDGHVLECAPQGVTVEVDDSIDLHVELPAGIELSSPGATSDAALRRVEREG